MPATPAPCAACRWQAHCLPQGLGEAGSPLPEGLVARRRVHAGQWLYREGEAVRHVYLVRSGSFKSSVMLAHGRDRVTGLHLCGDALGLDALAAGWHPTTATALEDAEACTIDLAGLRALAARETSGQRWLNRLLADEVARVQRHAIVLAAAATDARLAAFLLDFSSRLQALGYAGREFHLRMSRADIGSYLGMTLETASRTLSGFQQAGWLAVDKRHIRILDLAGLQGQCEEVRCLRGASRKH